MKKLIQSIPDWYRFPAPIKYCAKASGASVEAIRLKEESRASASFLVHPLDQPTRRSVTVLETGKPQRSFSLFLTNDYENDTIAVSDR